MVFLNKLVNRSNFNLKANFEFEGHGDLGRLPGPRNLGHSREPTVTGIDKTLVLRQSSSLTTVR